MQRIFLINHLIKKNIDAVDIFCFVLQTAINYKSAAEKQGVLNLLYFFFFFLRCLNCFFSALVNCVNTKFIVYFQLFKTNKKIWPTETLITDI